MLCYREHEIERPKVWLLMTISLLMNPMLPFSEGFFFFVASIKYQF